jgi:tripartite-type tricarboxylate transporter receptor subunit TctC
MRPPVVGATAAPRSNAMTHRIGTALALIALLAATIAGEARAQSDYPTRQITILVAVAAGSQADQFARLIAEPLQRKLGRPVVIENRPGGGQITGVNAAAKAAPDGYTLIHGNLSGFIISPQLRHPVPYDTPKDFAPIALTLSGPNVLVVDPKLPIHTAAELIAYAKAHPGQLNYGSHGAGSYTHVTTELFKSITGTDMVHVPFNGGGPLAIGFLSGQVQVVIFDLVSIQQHVKSGKARVIAQIGDEKSPLYPDVPLLSETIDPRLAADFWMGMAAPAGTPQPIVERLNREINAIINTPAFRAKGEAVSMYPQNRSPNQFGDKLAREWQQWGDVIRSNNLVVR